VSEWIDIGAEHDFPVGSRKTVIAENTPVLVLHLEEPPPGKQVEGDPIYAVQNICPHAGLPLDQGELCGAALTCPFHGYTYNVCTGANVDMPEYEPPVPVYPIKIEGGRVSVSVAKPADPN